MSFQLSQNQKDEISNLELFLEQNKSHHSGCASIEDLFNTIEHVLRDFNPPIDSKKERPNQNKARAKELDKFAGMTNTLRKSFSKLNEAEKAQINGSLGAKFSGTPKTVDFGNGDLEIRVGLNPINFCELLSTVERNAILMKNSHNNFRRHYLEYFLYNVSKVYPGNFIGSTSGSKFVKYLSIVFDREPDSIRDALKKFDWFPEFQSIRADRES